jgi:hypothetical protein
LSVRKTLTSDLVSSIITLRYFNEFSNRKRCTTVRARNYVFVRAGVVPMVIAPLTLQWNSPFFYYY